MSIVNLEGSRNGRKQFPLLNFPLEHRHLLWTIALVLATMSFFCKPCSPNWGLIFPFEEEQPNSLTAPAFWTVFSVETVGLLDGSLTGVTRSPPPSSSERIATFAKTVWACDIEPKLPMKRQHKQFLTYRDHEWLQDDMLSVQQVLQGTTRVFPLQGSTDTVNQI